MCHPAERRGVLDPGSRSISKPDGILGIQSTRHVEVSVARLMAIFLNPTLNPAWNTAIGTQQLLRQDDGSTVAMQVYPLPWPLSDREFVLTCSSTIDERRQTFHQRCRSVTHPAFPVQDGHVRAELTHSAWAFEALPGGGTQISFESWVDVKGSMPKAIVNAAQRMGSHQLTNALLALQQRLDLAAHPEYVHWGGDVGSQTTSMRQHKLMRALYQLSKLPFQLPYAAASGTARLAVAGVMTVRRLPARAATTLTSRWAFHWPPFASRRPLISVRDDAVHSHDSIPFEQMALLTVLMLLSLGGLKRTFRSSRVVHHHRPPPQTETSHSARHTTLSAVPATAANKARTTAAHKALHSTPTSASLYADPLLALAASAVVLFVWFARCLPAVWTLVHGPLLAPTLLARHSPWVPPDAVWWSRVVQPSAMPFALVGAASHTGAVALGLAIGKLTAHLPKQTRTAECAWSSLLFFVLLSTALRLGFEGKLPLVHTYATIYFDEDATIPFALIGAASVTVALGAAMALQHHPLGRQLLRWRTALAVGAISGLMHII